MALMFLMDKSIFSLENKKHVIGLFIDFSKDFDAVDHAIMLCKLSYYGIRGNALKWFESFLRGRQQYVTYNGVSSMKNTFSCGVPQGSILGPLPFLLYINDLSAACKFSSQILFADDTNLFFSGTNMEIMEKEINEEPIHISI